MIWIRLEETKVGCGKGVAGKEITATTTNTVMDKDFAWKGGLGVSEDQARGGICYFMCVYVAHFHQTGMQKCLFVRACSR